MVVSERNFHTMERHDIDTPQRPPERPRLLQVVDRSDAVDAQLSLEAIDACKQYLCACAVCMSVCVKRCTGIVDGVDAVAGKRGSAAACAGRGAHDRRCCGSLCRGAECAGELHGRVLVLRRLLSSMHGLLPGRRALYFHAQHRQYCRRDHGPRRGATTAPQLS